MTTGRQIVHAILVNSRLTARLLRESANIRAIGNAVYNKYLEMAQNGAGVDEILMKLPIDIIHEPREFAEKICREAEYLKSMPEYGKESLGKPQNKSGETPPNGYAKTAGKPQNKLDESVYPDNTDLLNNIFAECLYITCSKGSSTPRKSGVFKKASLRSNAGYSRQGWRTPLL